MSHRQTRAHPLALESSATSRGVSFSSRSSLWTSSIDEAEEDYDSDDDASDESDGESDGDADHLHHTAAGEGERDDGAPHHRLCKQQKRQRRRRMRWRQRQQQLLEDAEARAGKAPASLWEDPSAAKEAAATAAHATPPASPLPSPASSLPPTVSAAEGGDNGATVAAPGASSLVVGRAAARGGGGGGGGSAPVGAPAGTAHHRDGSIGNARDRRSHAVLTVVGVLLLFAACVAGVVVSVCGAHHAGSVSSLIASCAEGVVGAGADGSDWAAGANVHGVSHTGGDDEGGGSGEGGGGGGGSMRSPAVPVAGVVLAVVVIAPFLVSLGYSLGYGAAVEAAGAAGAAGRGARGRDDASHASRLSMSHRGLLEPPPPQQPMRRRRHTDAC